MTPPRIGFVGLGSMGGSLVRALCAAGHHPVVFDLDPDRVDEAVAGGAVAASSLSEVADGADIVGMCVADDTQVRSVFEGGLLDGLSAGSVLTLHSTLLPTTVRWVVEQAGPAGVGVVEAPVTGGAAAAAEGRVTMFLAGSAADLATIEPLVAACAERRVPTGELGQANLTKLCVNLQTYVTHRAAHEAASLATALGIGLDGLKAAMEANGQLGELTRNYLALHDLPAEMLADPGLVALRTPHLAIIAKDMRLMEQVAGEVGQDVPALRLAEHYLDDTYRMPAEAAGDQEDE